MKEACKNHKIEIVIINVQNNHVHMIVNCPGTLSDAPLLQAVKGLSSYLIFRICPVLRKRYPEGHFWSEGYLWRQSIGRRPQIVVDNRKEKEAVI